MKLNYNLIESSILSIISLFVFLIVVTFILIQLNKSFFKYLQRDKRSLHLRFFQNLTHAGIIVLAILFALYELDFTNRIYSMLFSSTVVITAVIGLAAQNILQDAFAGIALSINHPFEIGDRIILADVPKPCIVEDMTMRHVVLRTMDGIRYIIPNNAISDKIITHTSYHQRLRGTYISVPISYTADIRKAIQIIRDVIKQCPYTFPNNPDNQDIDGYGEVYLMSYDNDSLNLETTMWTEPSMDNFLATSEIRISILEAFREHDIEIPYSYTNVIIKEDKQTSFTDYTAAMPRNIIIKSDIITVIDYHTDISKCFDQVNQYCDFHSFPKKYRSQILLLTEELLTYANQIVKRTTMEFWIEGDQSKVILNLKTRDEFNRAKQVALIKNSANITKMHQFITNLKVLISKDIEPSGWIFESQNIKGHNIEKQLLINYADDVKIGLINRHLTFIVVKNLSEELE